MQESEKWKWSLSIVSDFMSNRDAVNSKSHSTHLSLLGLTCAERGHTLSQLKLTASLEGLDCYYPHFADDKIFGGSRQILTVISYAMRRIMPSTHLSRILSRTHFGWVTWISGPQFPHLRPSLHGCFCCIIITIITSASKYFRSSSFPPRISLR